MTTANVSISGWRAVRTMSRHVTVAVSCMASRTRSPRLGWSMGARSDGDIVAEVIVHLLVWLVR